MSVWVRDCPDWVGAESVFVEHGRGGEVFSQLGLVLGLGEQAYYLLRGGVVLSAADELHSGDVVRVRLRLRGGKGGFGNMLRGQGSAKKTTNFDACRDLSGRRLRVRNNEKLLASWHKTRQETPATTDRDESRNGKRGEDPSSAGGSREEHAQVGSNAKASFNEEDFENRLKSIGDRVSASVQRGMEAEENAKSAQLLKRSAELARADRLLKRRRTFLDVDGEGEEDDDEDRDAEHEEDHEGDASNQADGEEDDGIGMAAPPPAKVPSVAVTAPASSSLLVRFDAPSLPSREPSPVVSSLAYSVSTEPISDCGDSSYAHSEPAATEPAAVLVESLPDVTTPTTTATVPTVTTLDATTTTTTTTATRGTDFDSVDLQQFESATALETLGLDHLKAELQRLGLKCGGTLTARAERLFLTKNVELSTLNPKLFAKKTTSASVSQPNYL